MTDYYVSPTGGGNGSTPSSTLTMAQFFTVPPAPGDQALLTDGTYTGANSMITPTTGLSGNASQRIVVKAVNDGQVDIDGQGARIPLQLTRTTDYWQIQGINAHTSSGPVMSIKSNNNWFYRCGGWDAPTDRNVHVWSITGTSPDDTGGGYQNLVEDCFGFGGGRKMFESFDSHGNTFRRCWARWEGSINTGPKRDFQPNYHSYNSILDNCIGRWDGRMMPASYTLVDNGVPFLGGSCSGGVVQGDGSCLYPGTVLVASALGNGVGESEYATPPDPSPNGGSVISGFLGLVTTADIYDCVTGSSSDHGLIDCVTFGGQTWKDIFIYIAPGVTDRLTGRNPITTKLGAAAAATQSTLTNATAISAAVAGDSITAKYTVTNRLTGTTLAALGTGSLYDGASGATPGAALKYRYVNGVLTGELLWPWPMSARILAATTQASTDGHNHQIEDPDTLIQTVFGTFPIATPGGVWFTAA